MTVAYAWRIRIDMMPETVVPPTDADPDFHQSNHAIRDRHRVERKWPLQSCEQLAESRWLDALEAEAAGRSQEASRNFLVSAVHLERFDAYRRRVAVCYNRSASCHMTMGLPVVALRLTRRSIELDKATDEDLKLLHAARHADAAYLVKAKELASAPQTSAELLAGSIRYLLRHPTSKRLQLVIEVLDGAAKALLPAETHRLLKAQYLGACGDLVEAIEHLVPLRGVPEADRLSDEWTAYTTGQGLPRDVPVFDPCDVYTDIGQDRLVSRAFTLLAHGLYWEALSWFADLQRKNRNDAFVQIGYGLCMWKIDEFGAAQKAFTKSLELLEHPDRYRLVMFSRSDDTTHSRTYRIDGESELRSRVVGWRQSVQDCDYFNRFQVFD